MKSAQGNEETVFLINKKDELAEPKPKLFKISVNVQNLFLTFFLFRLLLVGSGCDFFLVSKNKNGTAFAMPLRLLKKNKT